MVNGFSGQKDGYGCGAYAFAHAMLLLGKTMTINESKKYCKTISYWDSIKGNLGKIEIVHPSTIKWIKLWKRFVEDPGTSELGIMRAIRKLQCSPIAYDTVNENKAKEWIEYNIKKGLPIICLFNFDQTVDDSGHWIVIGGKIKDKFIVIDSSPFDEEIIDYYSWKKLKERFIWVDEDEKKHFQFYGIAIKPEDKNLLKHSMVNRFHLVANKLNENEELREYWGYYTDDITEIFGYEKGVSADSLLSKYREQIIGSVSYWSGEENESSLNYLLDIYLMICKAYDIKINRKDIESTLIDFTAAFVKEAEFY